MFTKLFELFREVKNTNLTDEERFVTHKKILDGKKILKNCYNDFYKTMLSIEKKYLINKKVGVRIELGAGIGFIKKFDKNIITSDVIKNKFTDKTIDANKIPYGNNKISTIFGIFCFHHFKDQHGFLKDLEKKLKPGGLCILIEPYYGFLASLAYKKIHKSEYFDPNEKLNHKINNKTAMENANQALSYIYFKKNKNKFDQNFPKLEILEEYIFSNYLRFIISGGLNFKKLIPEFLNIFVVIVEILISPLKKILGVHYLIVLRKKSI